LEIPPIDAIRHRCTRPQRRSMVLCALSLRRDGARNIRGVGDQLCAEARSHRRFHRVM